MGGGYCCWIGLPGDCRIPHGGCGLGCDRSRTGRGHPSLGGGRRVWVLATLTDHIKVGATPCDRTCC